MPPDLSVMPEELQVAFFIYSILTDQVDATAGYFGGKDLSPLGTLYDIYEVENRELVTTFLMKIQQINVALVNENLQKKMKQSKGKNA